MPQLTAYYWLNQVTWSLFSLAIITYIIAIYILPPILELLVARFYVTKL